ncbi:Hypothetical protein NTJ_10540 [Nesidiocoris tenuis]|uniref:Uncharacterized protein n=1 Tax=Nesidiocoris tenuis TaxID=355587 RepID=A0ABN7B3I1_9HEMI|nr:Hypothetical protein NTJ_10540 [Nesidiocoris tenuis]
MQNRYRIDRKCKGMCACAGEPLCRPSSIISLKLSVEAVGEGLETPMPSKKPIGRFTHFRLRNPFAKL